MAAMVSGAGAAAPPPRLPPRPMSPAAAAAAAGDWWRLRQPRREQAGAAGAFAERGLLASWQCRVAAAARRCKHVWADAVMLASSIDDRKARQELQEPAARAAAARVANIKSSRSSSLLSRPPLQAAHGSPTITCHLPCCSERASPTRGAPQQSQRPSPLTRSAGSGGTTL